MTSFLLVVSSAMDGLLTFLVADILLLHFWWAFRSYLCFNDCPNIRKCPLIKLRFS